MQCVPEEPVLWYHFLLTSLTAYSVSWCTQVRQTPTGGQLSRALSQGCRGMARSCLAGTQKLHCTRLPMGHAHRAPSGTGRGHSEAVPCIRLRYSSGKADQETPASTRLEGTSRYVRRTTGTAHGGPVPIEGIKITSSRSPRLDEAAGHPHTRWGAPLCRK